MQLLLPSPRQTGTGQQKKEFPQSKIYLTFQQCHVMPSIKGEELQMRIKVKEGKEER